MLTFDGEMFLTIFLYLLFIPFLSIIIYVIIWGKPRPSNLTIVQNESIILKQEQSVEDSENNKNPKSCPKTQPFMNAVESTEISEIDKTVFPEKSNLEEEKFEILTTYLIDDAKNSDSEKEEIEDKKPTENTITDSNKIEGTNELEEIHGIAETQIFTTSNNESIQTTSDFDIFSVFRNNRNHSFQEENKEEETNSVKDAVEILGSYGPFFGNSTSKYNYESLTPIAV